MDESEREPTPGWPVTLEGVTESIVTTEGQGGQWNLAALGVFAPDASGVATARTWGRTRTRQNFATRGEGYVQFSRDPVDFVDAALAIRELDDPILASADGWTKVAVDRIDAGEAGGTEWVEWTLDPLDSTVVRRTVPTTNRGYNAVIEATVAASRLDVAAYDRATLTDRLAHLAAVVDRCGGEREQLAMDRLRDLTDWP